MYRAIYFIDFCGTFMIDTFFICFFASIAEMCRPVKNKESDSDIKEEIDEFLLDRDAVYMK